VFCAFIIFLSCFLKLWHDTFLRVAWPCSPSDPFSSWSFRVRWPSRDVRPSFVGRLTVCFMTLRYLDIILKDFKNKAWPFWWLLVSLRTVSNACEWFNPPKKSEMLLNKISKKKKFPKSMSFTKTIIQ
jgi:hypothetical protein